jgi:hypothetical protein
MYFISKATSKSSMTEKRPFGPGFSAEEADQADYMEIWGSPYEEPGLDRTEFRLIKDGVVFKVAEVGGY